jgi:hypothetical protein
MKCQEAEDLVAAHHASAEAYLLAIDFVIKTLSASRLEFWNAIKMAESAKDDWHGAIAAFGLHIAKHHCRTL